MASDITPAEFFKKYGLEVRKVDNGSLLAFATNKQIPIRDWAKIRHVPICDAPYEGALMTCFARDEHELMGFVTTAARVANYIQDRYDAAGCI